MPSLVMFQAAIGYTFSNACNLQQVQRFMQDNELIPSGGQFFFLDESRLSDDTFSASGVVLTDEDTQLLPDSAGLKRLETRLSHLKHEIADRLQRQDAAPKGLKPESDESLWDAVKMPEYDQVEAQYEQARAAYEKQIQAIRQRMQYSPSYDVELNPTLKEHETERGYELRRGEQTLIVRPEALQAGGAPYLLGGARVNQFQSVKKSQ